MSDFITIFKKIVVASTESGIKSTNQFKNIRGDELINKLRNSSRGNKDGSHFLRTTLKTINNKACMSRNDANIDDWANLLLIDGDKHINRRDEEINGASDPLVIHNILKQLNIGHIIYGSHSHYVGDKGNRYRIMFITNHSYNREQLPTTVEALILLINYHLSDQLLAYAKENNIFAQAWYFPRKPIGCHTETLYLEHLVGLPVAVVESKPLPPITHTSIVDKKQKNTELTSIHAFNEQYQLTDLLIQYGYKRKLITNSNEKWLSPNSTSGIAGITVKNNKFFSHHNNDFNDGYWHDAFDLMRVSEGLSIHDAVIKATQLASVLNDRSVYACNSEPKEQQLKYGLPRILPESRPPVLSLTPEMLAESIRDHIFDVAERQQSLPDFVAVTALVGLAGLLGNKAVICPKQHDDWAVTPNQWGAIIGRPSAMKSPSMKEALRPLYQLEHQANIQYKEEQQHYQEECILLELEGATAKNNAKRALKNQDREAARDALRTRALISPPTRRRLTVNDPTVEKLG